MSHSGRRSINQSSHLAPATQVDWHSFLKEASNEELIDAQESRVRLLTKLKLTGTNDEWLISAMTESLEDISTTLWNRGIRTEGIKEWLI